MSAVEHRLGWVQGLGTLTYGPDKALQGYLVAEISGLSQIQIRCGHVMLF